MTPTLASIAQADVRTGPVTDAEVARVYAADAEHFVDEVARH
jgi:hypothetical protein